jgi:hypothetical protein
MQQEKIALKTAAKIANVNGPLHKQSKYKTSVTNTTVADLLLPFLK